VASPYANQEETSYWITPGIDESKVRTSAREKAASGMIVSVHYHSKNVSWCNSKCTVLGPNAEEGK
jgi:hypothetical protein